MAKIKLTKSNIDRLEAGAKDLVYWDDAIAGFGLKVTPQGRKVFFVLYRTRGGAARLRKYTIGPYGIVTPATARAAAQRILAARQEGRDPAGEKRQARINDIRDRIDDVIETYFQRHASLKRSREAQRVLRREVLHAWSGKSVHAITKPDVVALLDQIVESRLAQHRQPHLQEPQSLVQLVHWTIPLGEIPLRWFSPAGAGEGTG
jgi:hypothetical protein